MRRMFFTYSLAVIVVGFTLSALVQAQEYTSPNYKVDELFIGAGGSNDATSPTYQSRASIGDLGIGNSTGSGYQAYGGFTTTGDPFLEVAVTSSSLDLGILSPTTTTTGTTTFRARAYLASGYVVMLRGAPPTNGAGNTITGLASNSAPVTGVEQFGLNLKANTLPTTFGAEVSQYPDASFSYGFASANYNTANSFRYNSGESIAQSNSSSGQTDYMISYIINVSPVTEAGQYTFRQNLVVVATY